MRTPAPSRARATTTSGCSRPTARWRGRARCGLRRGEMLSYYQWLAGLAALFIVLERLWPRVAGQRLFRRGWLSDVAYIVFNSKYAGVLLGYVTILWLGRLNAIFA